MSPARKRQPAANFLLQDIDQSIRVVDRAGVLCPHKSKTLQWRNCISQVLANHRHRAVSVSKTHLTCPATFPLPAFPAIASNVSPRPMSIPAH